MVRDFVIFVVLFKVVENMSDQVADINVINYP